MLSDRNVVGRPTGTCIPEPATRWHCHLVLCLVLISTLSCSPEELSNEHLVTMFNVLAHCFLVLSGLALACVTLILVFEGGWRGLETFLRVLALALGFFIYFGSRALGLSVPELIYAAMNEANPLGFWMAAVVYPAVGGFLVSWYLVMQFNEDTNITARVGIMISVFVLIMFAEVYASAFQISVISEGLNEFLLPNLSFVISLGLYAVLRVKTD